MEIVFYVSVAVVCLGPGAFFVWYDSRGRPGKNGPFWW